MAGAVTNTTRRADRQVPWRYISKRMRRRLQRTPRDKRFVLWLRCRRPAVYARLARYWNMQFWSLITTIDPWKTPFMSMALKLSASAVAHTWVTDELRPL
jgi:hypothetical protein